MKLIACTLPLLAGLPGALSAQIHVSFPQLTRPTVRASVGPITLFARSAFGGLRVGTAINIGTGSAGAASRTRSSSGGSASAARVLATGSRYLGTPYRYGGVSPVTGFDCSGFVQYVFGRQGVSLPRTSRQQASSGRALPLIISMLRPGDLMFFASGGRTINHVAIYAGNNRILHSSAGSGGVRYDDLSTPRGKWYLARLRASRRVL
jgi:cell wall-associated NlpC family hydrolase